MKIVIDIPQGLKIDFENENWTALTCAEMKNALKKGTILPKGHGDLISRKDLLKELEKWDWQDTYLPIHFAELVADLPSAEKTDSFIPQEDVAGILNTVESALKGTNYEVVGYDNTDGFLKVLIDVK